jgi:hypothetical protein
MPLEGSIVGKAFYARRFSLPEALHAMKDTASLAKFDDWDERLFHHGTARRSSLMM